MKFVFNLHKVILLASLFCLPFRGNAWGLLGHRIVGQIAEAHLTPQAKKAITAILGNESIAMASNWGDFIRSDSNFNYFDTWHYLNVPDNLSHDGMMDYLKKDTSTDAYTKLNFLVLQLKDKTLSREKKLVYLRMLIHIVGDIHQPLHVGRAEDRGGNDISITWFGAKANLHQVWDERLISRQDLSYTEYSASLDFTTKAQVNQLQQQPISEWIYTSYQAAQKIYAEITAPEQKLSYRYNFDHLATVNKQLLEGGIHLAGLLNQLFK